MTQMQKTIKLPWEFIDQIVVDELKEAIEVNSKSEDDKDQELLEALAECLRYYMVLSEANQFLEEYGL